MILVLDASVVVDLLLAQPQAGAIAGALAAAPVLAAPHLLDAEVAQVLRRFILKELLEPDRAEAALDDLAALPITRYPHGPLLPRVLELRDNSTAYDGLHLALAEVLGATLLTRDQALATVPGSSALVRVVD